MGKRAGCFALFVFLVSRECCVALPRVPWVCLQLVVEVFLDHTHLFFLLFTYHRPIFISSVLRSLPFFSLFFCQIW